MKSSGIYGAALGLIPAQSDKQANYNELENVLEDTVISGNNFYIFTGTVPPESTLQAYTDEDTMLAAHSAEKCAEIINFDLQYTYDIAMKRRTISKVPVDVTKLISAVSGTLTWGVLVLQAKSISAGDDLMIFTTAVGGWYDDDQSILVDNTVVEVDGPLTIKNINIVLQDALVKDLVTS